MAETEGGNVLPKPGSNIFAALISKSVRLVILANACMGKHFKRFQTRADRTRSANGLAFSLESGWKCSAQRSRKRRCKLRDVAVATPLSAPSDAVVLAMMPDAQVRKSDANV